MTVARICARYQAKIKETHNGSVLQTAEGTRVAFFETWSPTDLDIKFRRDWAQLLSDIPLTSSSTLVVVANLGVMHHIPGACNDEGGWSQGLALFKSILSEWFLGLSSDSRPSMRGFYLGTPSVVGLRNPGVTLGKAKRLDAVAARWIGKLGDPAPFPFQIVDLQGLTEARLDVTQDGFHFYGTACGTLSVGLLNMICNRASDFAETAPRPK